ncbi:hypothetical protein ACS91_22545, partial [Vibrio parahaemolyticus]
VVEPDPEPVLMSKVHKEEYGTGTFEFDSAKLTESVSERLHHLVSFLQTKSSLSMAPAYSF